MWGVQDQDGALTLLLRRPNDPIYSRPWTDVGLGMSQVVQSEPTLHQTHPNTQLWKRVAVEIQRVRLQLETGHIRPN